MFRATADHTPDGTTLRFEGRLVGAWVAAAETAWRDATASASGEPLAIDVCDVSIVDERGRALLVRMRRAGARLAVRGCAMRELLREIDAEAFETTDIQEQTRA